MVLFVIHLHFLSPGDALFFHSNLLHRSDKNESDMRRWSFLCAYNRADNDPVYEHHHAQYTPLHMVGTQLGEHTIRHLYTWWLLR